MTKKLSNRTPTVCSFNKCSNLIQPTSYRARHMCLECEDRLAHLHTQKSATVWFNAWIASTRNRGGIITITSQDIAEIFPHDLLCPVFKVPFSMNETRGPGKRSPTIDRIDPNGDYTKGNVQIISGLANKMKQDATPAELETFARWALTEGTKQ